MSKPFINRFAEAQLKFNTENHISNANTVEMEFLSVNLGVIEQQSWRLN